jgi:predicted ATPase
VTLIGVPGIGKSRLVSELMNAVEAVPELVVWRQGRALPYGEGVTFWALAEIVKAQAGILESDGAEVAERKLHRAVYDTVADSGESDWVEGHLRPFVGLGDDAPASDDRQAEAFAAWRRFFEGLAEQGPMILVFEDLHWADEGLLDFIDHLVGWASSVPLLAVCTARPELLTRRPGWGGGKPNAATVSLSPLSEEDTARLIASLLEQAVLPAEVQSALLTRAEGNPLYAEEYVRMLQDRGFLRRDGRGWRLERAQGLPLPESVQGLIAARLDALPSEEKALMQDASVLGKVFWLGAIAAISDQPRWSLEERLHALERKEFIRRERRSSVASETQYAFLHLLVRDVAYAQRSLESELEPGGRGHHRPAACAHGRDDLLWVDPLQIDRRRAEVGVPELALDDVQRHALARMRVTQLVGRKAAPDPGAGGEPAELQADRGTRPRSPARGAVDDAKQRPDRQLSPGVPPRPQLLPAPLVHADLASAPSLAVADQH